MQLSSYKEIVALLNSENDATLIFTRIKNEIEVDKLDPTISLEQYLTYKKEEREIAQRERIKKKREEKQLEQLKLTHDIIMGTIVEMDHNALKIKTVIEDLEVDLWFPKFSIMDGYRHRFNVLQEFLIRKTVLSYKREEALGKR